MIHAEGDGRQHRERRVGVAVDDLVEAGRHDELQLQHAHAFVLLRPGPVAGLTAEAARDCLRGLGVERTLRVGAVRPVARRMHVQQAWVQRAQLVVAEPELLRDARAEPRDEHVGVGDLAQAFGVKEFGQSCDRRPAEAALQG